MSKSFRRYGTSDSYRDDKDFRQHRKDIETKNQKKRTSAALKRRDVSDFYDDEEEDEQEHNS